MTRQEIALDIKKAEGILWETGLLLGSKVSLESSFPIVSNPTPLSEYRRLIENRQYTFLLKDGSVIQMGFEFDAGGRIRKHKLAFFQSPLARIFDPDTYLFSSEDVVNALDTLMERKFDGEEMWLDTDEPDPGLYFPLIYSFRLDYDEAGPNDLAHPKSHATIFSKDCRIAANNYFDVRTFLLLVFGNLWSEYGRGALNQLRDIPRRTFTQNPGVLPGNYNQFFGVHLSL